MRNLTPTDRGERAPVAPRSQSLRPRTWARRLLGPFHVTGIFWYRAIHFGMRAPEPLVRLQVALWSVFFACTCVVMRRVLARNLEGPLGPCGFWERQRRVLRSFYGHAWSLVERFERMREPPVPMEIDYQGADWEGLVSSGRGLVVVTAHQSNWEAGLLRPLAGEGRRMHVVREAEESAGIQDAVARGLQRAGGGRLVTHFLGDDARLGVTLLAALRRGDVVTLSGDRPHAGTRTVRVVMFGRWAELPQGPLLLARAAGVPILPVFVFRTGRRRYRCVAQPLITVADHGDRWRDVGQAAAALARQIEWAIREAPHQWARWESVWEPRVEGGKRMTATGRARAWTAVRVRSGDGDGHGHGLADSRR